MIFQKQAESMSLRLTFVKSTPGPTSGNPSESIVFLNFANKTIFTKIVCTEVSSQLAGLNNPSLICDHYHKVVYSSQYNIA